MTIIDDNNRLLSHNEMYILCLTERLQGNARSYVVSSGLPKNDKNLYLLLFIFFYF